MNMNDSQKTLFHIKDMSEVNSQEHAYCQLKEGSKEKDCGIEHVSINTPPNQEDFGSLNRSCKNNMNVEGNLEQNKTIESNSDYNNTGKIIYPESKEIEKNTVSNIKELHFHDTYEECCINEDSNVKNTVICPTVTNSLGKRKLHKSYMISWGTQISCNGYAKCLIETCNFISLDLQTMQEHYKTCDGVQNYNYNLCSSCNSWLSSENELIIHKSRCKNGTKNFLQSPYKKKEPDDIQAEESEIKDNEEISLESVQNMNSRNLQFVENKTKISREFQYCLQCDKEFLSDMEYSQHLLYCKPVSSGRLSVIKRKRDATIPVIRTLKENIIEEDKESHIIQPGRNIPKGEYVRRRAYTKQHKAAWEAAMEKCKHVKCIFQNCHFLALSVEDMISHYGYCNGDGSFAKFICPFCEGRVTSEKLLEIHCRRSHAVEHYDVINSDAHNVKMLKEDSYLSAESENKDSPGRDTTCWNERELDFTPETPERGVEAKEEGKSSDRDGKRRKSSSNMCSNEERAKESGYVQQNNKFYSQSQTQVDENACESSYDSTNNRNIQEMDVEGSNLPKEQTEFSVDDSSQNNDQKIQYSSKISNERDNKDDHLYFKRKRRTNCDSELKDSLSVMKNKNVKHYSGPKNVNEEVLRPKDDEPPVEKECNDKVENEGEPLSNKTVSDSDTSGKYVRQMIKFSFPTAQNAVRREIHPSYTNSWAESIKTNGYARCLVATCNFISLDIFHIENHFKTCSGVPENGPNLCTFCDSRLPSAVELWIHKSMCKANGEVNASLTDISQSSEENKKDNTSKDTDRIEESSTTTAETENPKDSQENEDKTVEKSDSSNGNNDAAISEMCPRKETMSSLRISDIMKLKDNGTMDYNRIIQPGPVLPKGQYIRRRSYTKTHKAVWEAALEKHKYVKCIFQNCHFLAMSLEDMIYHFGYCIGDGSFAKFECPHCGGRLTAKVILDIHIQISHSDKITNENNENLLPSNGEGEEMIFHSLDNWKKLIAKKEIKTYGKISSQSKIKKSKMSDVVTTEETDINTDDCFICHASELAENKRDAQTFAAELEAEKRTVANNSIFDSAVVGNIDSHSENQTYQNNNINKSSHLQILQESKKGCEEICPSKIENEKTGSGADEGKTVDSTEILDKTNICKERSRGTRSLKNICNTKENSKIICEGKDPSVTENLYILNKSADINENSASLVSENDPNIENQDVVREKMPFQEKEEIGEKNSNKNDQMTKNNTEYKKKRGRGLKSLTKEVLSKEECASNILNSSEMEGTRHEPNDTESSQEPVPKIAKVETLESENVPKAMPIVEQRKRGRPPKKQVQRNKASEVETNKVEEQMSEPPKKGRRGRKRKNEIQNDEIQENKVTDNVKCAKCDFETKRHLFTDHNYRKHVGLSWIEGENPVNLDEEDVISWNIKQAFRYIKSATCANCGSVKKSALGFISHIQNCGKSEEEKDALKVKCPHCPARILKYSLPMHLKLSHSDSEGNKSLKEHVVDEEQPSKRKSALKAVDKFHEVLKQYDDDEDDIKKKIQYVVYEKGVSKFPKVPSKIRGLWSKMMKEKKKIPCRRGSCVFESSSIQEARSHHFSCSELPDKSYVCQQCDFYTTCESVIQQHVNIHSKTDGDFTVGSDDERLEDEAEMKECAEDEESELTQNKLKLPSGSSDENALETAYKARFFARERLLNGRQMRFCRFSLQMTLESEMEELKENCLIFTEINTEASDWIPVEPENCTDYLPSLQESVSFRINNKNNNNNNSKTSESDWKKVKRFMGEIIEGSAVIFTGGSILAISWCKYSCIRSSKQNLKQYLAVSSCRKMDKFQNIHEECSNFSGLIQIYSCGQMKTLNDVKEVPEMVLGIVHDSGEVWDLAWFPLDTFKESENKVLTRIGLLGAACQDGTVKIWSICDPDELQPKYSLPLYKIHPKVILELEDKPNVGCLRLALGRTGIVVGGYGNGIVAVWNLKSISSPFCRRSNNSLILKPHISFQAHRTSITALSICQNSDRYISTSGLDRFIKFWDLQCPGNPFEKIQREVCLDNVWPKHWPLTISTFENIVPCSGKGMIKAIRDVYCDKHRTPLALEHTCWSLSFNEWLNILCGCNNIGEVKIRYLRNMFLADEKFRLRTGNIFCTTELKFLKDIGKEKVHDNGDVETCKGNNKKSTKKYKDNLAVPRTYEEADQYFGLIFNDYVIEDDSKQKTSLSKAGKKDGWSIEEYPIASVNKVCWNPNYKRFMQLAIGYHCGLIRIKPLNDTKCDEEIVRFLRESEDKISKLSLK